MVPSGVECGISGASETITVLKRHALMRETGLMCTMMDYANCNLQHTLEAQAAVFKALSILVSDLKAPPDFVHAIEWCRLACLNQWCTFPGESTPRRIVQGLFSGQRGTNFINTLLNVAYFKLATKHVSPDPVSLCSIHHGDDLWITNRDNVLKKCLKPGQGRVMETIFAAVASSPYKDIATAQKAFSCGKPEALDY